MGKATLSLVAPPLAATTLLLLLLTATNEGMSLRCERQARREKMEHCQQYVRSQTRMMMHPNAGNQACCLRECCEMLQDMDEECVCEAVESLAETVRERMMVVGGGGREMGQMLRRTAMELPRKCKVTTRGCDIITTTSY